MNKLTCGGGGPVPRYWRSAAERQDGVYLRPPVRSSRLTARDRFQPVSAVARTRRRAAIRSKPDHEILYRLADRLDIAGPLFHNIEVRDNEPVIEDITREFNRGMWTIGYTGQTPERLRKHMANMATFDRTTLKAEGGPCDGEYYGLPWPCWGDEKLAHPGTPILYDTSQAVADGGLTFRARFGILREGENLLADGSFSKGSEIEDGYPEFTMAMLKRLGWDKDLSEQERSCRA